MAVWNSDLMLVLRDITFKKAACFVPGVEWETTVTLGHTSWHDVHDFLNL